MLVPQAVEKDIDFLRVDCQPIAESIRNQAEVWKTDYGRILRTVALQKMETIENTIATLNVGLSTAPTDLLSLKHVLAVIAEVREMKMDMELEYSDVQERYRTLRVYDIPVDEAEYQRAMALDSLWRDTVNGALTKDMRLIKVTWYIRSGT